MIVKCFSGKMVTSIFLLISEKNSLKPVPPHTHTRLFYAKSHSDIGRSKGHRKVPRKHKAR